MLDHKNLISVDKFGIMSFLNDGSRCCVIANCGNEQIALYHNDYLSCIEYLGEIAKKISNGNKVLYVEKNLLVGCDPYDVRKKKST